MSTHCKDLYKWVKPAFILISLYSLHLLTTNTFFFTSTLRLFFKKNSSDKNYILFSNDEWYKERSKERMVFLLTLKKKE